MDDTLTAKGRDQDHRFFPLTIRRSTWREMSGCGATAAWSGFSMTECSKMLCIPGLRGHASGMRLDLAALDAEPDKA